MSKNNSKSRAVTDSTQSVLGAAGLNPLLLGVERDQVFGLGVNLTPASIQGKADVADASLDFGVQSDDAAQLALDSTVIVADETAEAFALSASMPHDDPLFVEQWYLFNNDTGIDINVLPVWEDYDGTGVTVGIWDDGVQSNHPDLADNYDSSLHIILENGDVHDPEPEDTGSAHGTAVAGIIAGVDNEIGVIGVAHGASIAGVDMFFDEALGVSIYTSAIKHFDVTNHSWGWTGGYYDSIFNPDDFALGEPFWADFHAGFHDGVIEGRGGLGTITVTSAGNSRTANRTTSDQYMTSMPETIAVAAVGHDGFVSWYSTPGASVVVSAPSSDRSGDPRVWTTDRTGEDGYNSAAAVQDLSTDTDYTSRFGGTSSAAPMVAGVTALMLEANPDLGWRDVQEILASSARHVGSDFGEAPQLDERFSWAFNGDSTWNLGGRHFSHDYGFGLVDAYAAVRLAETWTNQQISDNWLQVEAATWSGDLYIPDILDPNHQTVSLTLTSEEVMELETVAIELHFFDETPDQRLIESSFLGDYRITLTSPSGTVSTLTLPFNRGTSVDSKILMHSNALRGEATEGDWTLEITDEWSGLDGALEYASLTFQGDEETPDDLFVFTEEFGELAGGAFGHGTHIDAKGGNDTVNTSAIASDTVLNLASGDGTIDGVAVTGLGSIENAFTGDGDDLIIGGNGANLLDGGRGNDEIHGGNGPDVLVDGAGSDMLSGGRGPDLFSIVFDGDDDWIFDFNFRQDTIAFAGVGLGDLAFSQVDDFVRIDASSNGAVDSLYVQDDSPKPLTLASVEDWNFDFLA